MEVWRRWWQIGVVAIVAAVPNVLRDVFVEIEFYGFRTFLVDLDGLRDPAVGTCTVDVDGADSVETFTFDLECVR